MRNKLIVIDIRTPKGLARAEKLQDENYTAIHQNQNRIILLPPAEKARAEFHLAFDVAAAQIVGAGE